MRVYTILKKIIQKVVAAVTDISSLKSTKQNKAWKSLGSTTGTLTYALGSYTEMSVYVVFGGVQVGQSIPVSLIPSSGTLTLYVGYYSGVIYVQLSKTSAKITSQPTGYTGTLKIYAR